MSENAMTRRSFFKYAGLTGAACLSAAGLVACGGGQGASSQAGSASSGSQASGSASASSAPSASSASSASTAPSAPSASASAAAAVGGASVVVFFSRADENPEVGYVEQGNTSKVAYSISGKIVSDVFEIVPQQPYPASYDECVSVAADEQNANARPAYVQDLPNFDQYDVVYLGYPIWLGDLPMIVYSFLEAHDWSGKVIAPFCTYGGSGISGTVESVRKACPGATVTEGLGLKGSVAQNDSSQVNTAVNEWLAKVRS